MAAKGGGESRAGLVVFLVLFVLISIGLGVTTYLGYKDIADAERKAEDAKKEKTAWENDANWYKYVADTYRMYIGAPPPAGDDVAAMRTEYGSGAKAREKAKADEHKKLLDTLDTNLKWDQAVKKPADTYQDEIEKLKKELTAKEDARKKAEERAVEMEATAETRKREKEEAEKNYKTELAKVKSLSDASVKAKDDAINDLTEKLNAATEASKKGLTPLLDENAKLRTENKDLTAKLQSAVKTITERGYEAERKQSAEEIDVTKINPANLATVVRISGSGEMPYISLGSADNLKPQVTFSIYGKGVDGKPLKEPKGKLEVVRIVDAHLAQARVTEMRDERRDPVVSGDFLFNPAWNPNLKQHVAIVGRIDLTGEGHDNTQEFIRTLKRQNVEVDAWMDMKTLKMNGDITRQTDMLILGTYPDFGTGATKADDPKAERKNQALDELSKVEEQAKKLGVRLVRLNAFLEMSGYSLPKPLGADKGKIEFQRNLPAVGSPVERREGPK